MRIADFDLYKDLLKEKSGIVVTPDKSYLLDSRLTPVAKKWGYNTIDAMTVALRALPDTKLVKDIVEAMTTNETSFFRDTRPFDLFKDRVLPYMIEKRKTQGRFRIWSAASSSGQEAYSLSMIMKEAAAKMGSIRAEILGTDISDEILDQARNATYTQFEVQRGLPVQYLMKYFEQTDKNWTLKNEIKNMVQYKNFNLLTPMTSLGSFDIIFCRNVLIYFNEETKRDILERMSRILAKDGGLYLGGAETVLGITEAFKPIPGIRGLYSHKEADIELPGVTAAA